MYVLSQMKQPVEKPLGGIGFLFPTKGRVLQEERSGRMCTCVLALMSSFQGVSTHQALDGPAGTCTRADAGRGRVCCFQLLRT